MEQQVVMSIPQVPEGEAAKFSQVWNHNGVNVIIDPVALKFATDFANVCLRSVFAEMIHRAQQMQRAQQEKTSIVLEGE